MHRLRIPLYAFLTCFAAAHAIGLGDAIAGHLQGLRPFRGLIDLALLGALAAWIVLFLYTGLAIDWRELARRHGPWSGALLAACSLVLVAFVCPGRTYVPMTVAGTVAALALVFGPLPLVALGLLVTSTAAVGLSLAGHAELAPETVLSGVLTLGAALVVRYLHLEYRTQVSLLDQARWAASKLPTIILRLDSTIRQERGDAVSQERRRVAQAVHDTVGYSLTALIAQLTSIQNAVADREAVEKLHALEELSRSVLRETRQFVANMREDRDEERVDWPERWKRTCETFSDCTGVRVHLQLDPVRGVPDQLGAAVYHIIQEGLTNAYRHGHATFVAVTLLWRAERSMLLMKVSDNGKGVASVSPGSGLSGIRERAESLGGSVLWKTHPNRGFDLAVDVPCAAPSEGGQP